MPIAPNGNQEGKIEKVSGRKTQVMEVALKLHSFQVDYPSKTSIP